MNLIIDPYFGTRFQILSESKTSGVMRLSGIFGECDTRNQNKRKYPRAIMEREVNKLAKLAEQNRLCGELDHPTSEIVKYSNASHKISKLFLEGNLVKGTVELLNTPAGLTAQALVRGGVNLGLSSRGLGTLSEDNDGGYTVNENYRMVTYDLVGDPSFSNAYPQLLESKNYSSINDILSAKSKKEENFLKLLERKLMGETLDFEEEDFIKNFRLKR